MHQSKVYCEPFHIVGGREFEIHKVIYKEDQPYECYMHFHEVHELIFFDDIEGTYSHCLGNTAMQNNDIVFTPANDIHDFDLSSQQKSWTIIQFIPKVLENKEMCAYQNIFKACKVFRLPPEKLAFLRTLVKELHTLYVHFESTPHVEFLLKLILSTVGEFGKPVGIEEAADVKISSAFKKLMPVMQYAKTNADSDISLDEAAASCFMSPSHFSKVFKSVYKVSFSEYKLRLKIHSAARQLVLSADSVTQLSYAYKFASPSHFIHQFKKQLGLTPKQYQKQFSDVKNFERTQQLSTPRLSQNKEAI